MDAEEEALVAAIDAHLRKLREANTQPLAVAWMKTAHELLSACASELERPRIFAMPSYFGPPTLTLRPPKPLVLLRGGLGEKPPVWCRGQTVVYENRTQPWTAKDTRRLEAEVSARRQAAAQGKRFKLKAG